MNRYKVIWFDDEFDTLNIIRERAYRNEIELIGFNNAKEGIEELQANIKYYDAALIDGIFFEEPNSVGTPNSDKALFDVAMAIERLSHIKKLPWFILSGQMSFTKENNRYAEGLKQNEVYDKLSDSDQEKLWQNIKKEADEQVHTQIRHRYQDAFEICSEDGIGLEAGKTLLFLLESLENESHNTEDKLNAIRKILENVFQALNGIKILPDEVFFGKGSLTQSSNFLRSEHSGFILNQPILPGTIAYLLKSLMDVTQDASHAVGNLRLGVDNFVKNQSTGYLYKSVVYQLLEVLVWIKTYYRDKKSLNNNHLIYSKIDTDKCEMIEGEICKDVGGNYFCDDILLTYNHMKLNKYETGDRIKISKIAINTNEKTSHLYQRSASISNKV